MTRINLIPPIELYDQHLRAEFKEILQLCGSFRKTLESKAGFNPTRIPLKFTLNKGHVYFFYNKGLYLKNRFELVKQEMIRRGFNTKKEFPKDIWPLDLYNNWEPNEEAYRIIRERIASKVALKPEWYKYTKPMDCSNIPKD